MKSFKIFSIIIISIFMILISCSDKSINSDDIPGDFDLAVSADTLISYDGGGGLTVLKLVPDSIFNEIVKVSISADNSLNANLTDTTISKGYPIIELNIAPNNTVKDTLDIIITCTCHNLLHNYRITVIMHNFSGTTPQEFIDAKDDFTNWLSNYDVEYKELSGMIFKSYRTNLGTYGSESWVFLNNSWELKISATTSIDPIYKMRIRYRGEWDYQLALRRNLDGTIETIPL